MFRLFFNGLLLVGTGAGGLPIGDALEAIIRAAVAANKRLAGQGLDRRVLVDRLEIYEDVAINAAEALGRLLQSETLGSAVRWPAKVVEAGRGGHRRVRFESPPEWYHRLEITEEAGRLRFVFPTDRARAEETLATGQLTLAQTFVQAASQNTGQNSEASKTLFEMLLPLRLRELTPQQGNLAVMVDEKTAPYPWELLEDRWSNSGRPPAVAGGFIRQFRTTVFRQRPVQGLNNTALVIGNPDLGRAADFADLPGAREEARMVAEQLSHAGYDVLDCIDQTCTPIMESLHKNSWRMIHLAGHGVHRYVQPNTASGDTQPVSGMVIGNNSFLTAGDMAQLRFVPELVFVNCCHLGRVDGPRALDRLGLAANLGEELIRMGVRAVIAAGWAVDDRAGQLFAATFYRYLLEGEAFGEAVRLAREEVWTRCPDVNTWGAYQCYGDPAFRLHRDGSTAPAQWPDFGTPHELVTALNNLIASLRAGGPTEHGSELIAKRLARIPQVQTEQWLQRADVCAALGLVWGELGQWETAVNWLDKAFAGEQGDYSMRAVEQHASFRVRLAAERWHKAQHLPTAKRGAVRVTEIAHITAAIRDLDMLCSRALTVKRLNLLGSAYKRLALIESAGSKRHVALTKMAQHYEKSLAHKRDAYAFTNWLTAILLLHQQGEASIPNTAGLQQQMTELQHTLSQTLEGNPNFCDAANLADLSLCRLLLGAQGTKRRAKLSASEAAAPVLSAYRSATTCASPRETASLTENLAFLKTLWSPTDQLTNEVLDYLQESLT